MNYPLVSVIIPNYNYGRFISEAIDSVLAQTYRNIEIIVVDDGSNDETSEVLKIYNDKLKWVKQSNQGVANARNNGVGESRGKFIAFLDSDDIWFPEKIEKQIKIFLSDDEIGLVHCGFVDFDNNGNFFEEHLDGLEGWVALDMLRYQKKSILGGGSAVLVTKKAFDKVGGFDQSVSPAEDWEFYYRVARHYKVGLIPEVLLKYRVHGNNNHLNIPRMERAILGAFDKAFCEKDAKLEAIRSSCYGKIHSVLAGSYFRAGKYKDFFRHTLKSLWFSPSTVTQFIGFPLRFVQRRFFQIKPFDQENIK